MITWLKRRLGYHVCTWSKWETTKEGNLINSWTRRIIGTYRLMKRTCVDCGDIQSTMRRDFVDKYYCEDFE